jgi:glycosyltransferase involved in cell wall biosynthesis
MTVNGALLTSEAGAGRLTALAVIIPTRNEEATIRACVQSVGDHYSVRVVVSDGDSADGTLGIVKNAFPHVLIVTGPSGRGGQLNRGAAAAAAHAYLFLHADCRLPAGWWPAVRAVLGDPDMALGCFRLHTEPPTGCSRGVLARAWWRLLDLRSLGFGLPYGDQGQFVRRDVFSAVAGFPDIPLMEDLAFAHACLGRGRIEHLPNVIRTTARRFARHPLRARVCTATFPFLYRCGVSPERLARWYGEVR